MSKLREQEPATNESIQHKTYSIGKQGWKSIWLGKGHLILKHELFTYLSVSKKICIKIVRRNVIPLILFLPANAKVFVAGHPCGSANQ